jgi:aspartyl-tRNA(Asn)/glutamyl-tRNA(Gln) amidotransferase subunit C
VTLSADDVRHVALLARLGLGPGDEDYYAQQLSGILGHIDRLRQVDTDAIPPTAQVVPLELALRQDETIPCLGQQQAVANAPEQRDGMFVVRAIQEPEP